MCHTVSTLESTRRPLTFDARFPREVKTRVTVAVMVINLARGVGS
jgi:hypothetical protein